MHETAGAAASLSCAEDWHKAQAINGTGLNHAHESQPFEPALVASKAVARALDETEWPAHARPPNSN